jgi:hypothetical protein
MNHIICNVVHSNNVASLKLVGSLLEQVVELPGSYDADNHVWTVWDCDVTAMDWYYYLINDEFCICDALTTDWTFVAQHNVIATRRRCGVEITEARVDARLCESFTGEGFVGERTLFSKNDPLVILALEIVTSGTGRLVITVEWTVNGSLYLFSSKPFEVAKQKMTFTALPVAAETPLGDWACTLYVGTKNASRHDFKMVNSKAVETRSAFLDMQA